MRDWKFHILFSLLTVIFLSAFYFIVVNTLFAHKVLGVVKINGQYVSFLPEADLQQAVSQQVTEKLPQFLEVNLDGTAFTVATNDLHPQVNTEKIMQFGKGHDLGKVLGESIQLLSGKVVDTNEVDLKVDTSALITGFPYKISNTDFAYLDGSAIKNCDSHAFNLTFNNTKAAVLAEQALKDNKPLTLKISDLISDPTQADLIGYCEKYWDLAKQLTDLTGGSTAGISNWSAILDYNLNNNSSTRLKIASPVGFTKLLDSLQGVKTRTYIAPDTGSYVQKGSVVYVYKAIKPGRELNIQQTADNLQNWLNQPVTQAEILSFTQKQPDFVGNTGLQVVNITKKLAEGKSRLDIFRNGLPNTMRITYAQRALDSIDTFILQPGQEFSFIRDTGIKSGKISVGLGVCNATTTLFRTALMAGFPITERHGHTSFIWSYEYPNYPINNVEATFFGGPVLDLKFVNDLDKPVMLKTTIDRSPNDGWQYHTVEVYTSPETPNRQTELTDFKKWNIRSDVFFTSSFTRTVKTDGVTTRQDTFTSRYYN